jgi:protein involved in polysaccharide export with SLBB domain
MRFRFLRPLLTAAAVFAFGPLGATLAGAQTPTVPGGQRPPADQAQQLLQSRPDLVQQLQQRLGASGLSPDQVRARLRARATRSRCSTPTSRAAPAAPEPAAGRPTGAGARRRRVARHRGLDRARRAAAGTPASPRGAARADRGPRLRRRQRAARAIRLRDTSRYARDSARAARDSGLAIFGLDLFQNASSTLFDPNLAGPVDQSYQLGPGDRLVLVLTGDVESAYNLLVTREGFIVVPQAGQIFVNSLTLGQLEAVLAQRLGRIYSGIRSGSTRFSVSVARLRSNQVFVVGDVTRPGSYRVSSAGTALTALYAAGGPSEAGSLRRIEVRRGGRTVDVLDVYDYLTRGDASRDARLQNGDVVFVPPRLARVRALGEVLRPGTYEVKPGETLAELLRVAGGLTALASPQRVTVERVLPPAQRVAGGRDRVVLDVGTAQGSAAVPAVPLVNGDVVRVARASPPASPTASRSRGTWRRRARSASAPACASPTRSARPAGSNRIRISAASSSPASNATRRACSCARCCATSRATSTTTSSSGRTTRSRCSRSRPSAPTGWCRSAARCATAAASRTARACPCVTSCCSPAA